MAKIISVINYKGGVGKTTITLQLGIALATLANKKVLLVDLDPQCSLSLSTLDEHYWADRIDRFGSIRDVIQTYYDKEGPRINPDWIINNALDRAWDSIPGNTENLDLLPSHLDLPDYEMKLVKRKPRHILDTEEYYLTRDLILKDAFQELKKKYDYILLDCPPNIYMVSRNAILSSDYYLIPTIPDFISCYGIPFILQHIENIQKEVREKGKRARASFLGIVRNRMKFAQGIPVKEHEEQTSRLITDYDERLFESVIKDRIGVAELPGARKNIHQESAGKFVDIRREFEGLANEFLGRIEGKYFSARNM